MLTVIVAEPDLLPSTTLVAVTVKVVLGSFAGIVTSPPAETVDATAAAPEIVHLTSSLMFPTLVTVAVNCCVPGLVTVAFSGVTFTDVMEGVTTFAVVN